MFVPEGKKRRREDLCSPHLGLTININAKLTGEMRLDHNQFDNFRHVVERYELQRV